MTREIAVEYARKGANALCPGPVNTPLLAKLLENPAARARRLVHGSFVFFEDRKEETHGFHHLQRY